MTSFYVICGLGLPQTKNLGTPMNWRSPEKNFWRPFFWRTLAPVSLVLGLGLEHSCPWPREVLSSERLSLALASDFFTVLGLGLEPCVLDSTSAKHSADMCVFLLKQAVSFYNKHDTPVYATFLDASKAYDRVDHYMLFKKMILCNIPLCLVRLLLYWYKSQMLCIKWGSHFSEFFGVSNGV